MKSSIFHRITIAGLLFLGCLNAQAAPYFTNKEGNMVWDKSTGLVWMRCSFGQTWDGRTCTGEAKNHTYDFAIKATESINNTGGYFGFSDWELPSARQLLSLRLCSHGQSTKTENIQDEERYAAQSCADGSLTPTIDISIFPNTPKTYFWSFSSFSQTHAWMVSFRDGWVTARSKRHYSQYLRLVRANQLAANEAISTFPLNLTEKHLSAERKAKNDRDMAERKARDERQAAENKAHADRAQALSQLNALGPRGLYLEAGKAQRNGAVTFVNTSFGASQLYEMIVDKFPDSEYAVKATDQLTAMSRSSRDASAAQSAVEQSNFNAKQRAYESCKVEMNSCFSRTNGRGNCYRDCERLR